jgi:hypothetical protein
MSEQLATFAQTDMPMRDYKPTSNVERSNATPKALPWYRREIWLVFALAAAIPVTAGFIVEESMKLPIMSIGAALLLVSGFMLMQEERKRASKRKPAADIRASSS